jgi:hypothetical protein
MNKKISCTGDTSRQDFADFFSEKSDFYEYLPGKSLPLEDASLAPKWMQTLTRLNSRSLSIIIGATAGPAIEIGTLKAPCQISVIVTTYRPSIEKLERCLKSVQRAAYPILEKSGAVEVVIIDDCSEAPQEIFDLVNRLQSEKRSEGLNIRILRLSQNSGVGAARNKGLEIAKYDWCVILDYDDFIAPSHLALYALEFFAGSDLIASDMKFPDGHVFCASRPTSLTPLFTENCFGSGIGINRTAPSIQQISDKGGLYNSENRLHYEDWELNIVLTGLGANIAVIPVATYFYDLTTDGRNSINTEHRYCSALDTPLNALKRISAVDPVVGVSGFEKLGRLYASKLAEIHNATGGMVNGDHVSNAVKRLTSARRAVKKLDTYAKSSGTIGWMYKAVRPLLDSLWRTFFK